jgi:hypothetical protein
VNVESGEGANYDSSDDSYAFRYLGSLTGGERSIDDWHLASVQGGPVCAKCFNRPVFHEALESSSLVMCCDRVVDREIALSFYRHRTTYWDGAFLIG